LVNVDKVRRHHVLRHTFVSGLLDKYVDLVTVQQLMGHERVDSTTRCTKPNKRDMEVAVSVGAGEL
jgi:site-specific recombinase XerD